MWFVLLFLFAAGLTMVAAPMWLIQPFRGQTPRAMRIGYGLRFWSPFVTLIVSVLAAAIVVSLWRGTTRLWKKTSLVVVLLLSVASAWLARQNHFEWMFRPLPNAEYARAGDTDFVLDEDKVIAIEVNGEAVAYPVRQMAYHHVVQDEVGGVPIAATY
jgi:hypothetical protein